MNIRKWIKTLNNMLVVVMIFGLFASIGVMNIDSVKAQSQPQSVLLLSDDRFFADVDMDIPAIQAFLERQPGILKSYDAQVGDETQSAAIIIMVMWNIIISAPGCCLHCWS